MALKRIVNGSSLFSYVWAVSIWFFSEVLLSLLLSILLWLSESVLILRFYDVFCLSLRRVFFMHCNFFKLFFFDDWRRNRGSLNWSNFNFDRFFNLGNKFDRLFFNFNFIFFFLLNLLFLFYLLALLLLMSFLWFWWINSKLLIFIDLFFFILNFRIDNLFRERISASFINT